MRSFLSRFRREAFHRCRTSPQYRPYASSSGLNVTGTGPIACCGFLGTNAGKVCGTSTFS